MTESETHSTKLLVVDHNPPVCMRVAQRPGTDNTTVRQADAVLGGAKEQRPIQICCQETQGRQEGEL